MTHVRHVLLPAMLSAVLLVLPGGSEIRADDTISLALPLACVIGETCFVQNYVDRDATPKWKDYRCGEQTYDGHDGTDIRVPSMDEQRAGVDVLAAAAGTVIGIRDGVADISIRDGSSESIKGRECGNGVVIDHGQGWETQYCHMAKGSLAVKPGDMVTKGQSLGKSGSTGLAGGDHLHFSMLVDGRFVNATEWWDPHWIEDRIMRKLKEAGQSQ